MEINKIINSGTRSSHIFRKLGIACSFRQHHRCIALEGSIGVHVRCTIYDGRPSPCRNFMAAWQDDIANDQCNRARALYGLPVFGIM
ncbi:MAG: YkgJ family cysteine cluster protein [Deltaproteobacteria bacterium]